MMGGGIQRGWRQQCYNIDRKIRDMFRGVEWVEMAKWGRG